MLRGIEGFGAKQCRYTTRILSLSLDLPIVIEAIDREDKVRAICRSSTGWSWTGSSSSSLLEVVTHRSDGAPA